MSESSLVTYRVLNSKNVNNRGRNTIKYIIPHCYVGQITAKRGVDAFNSRSDASVHYVVGKDFGDIGQQVSETFRAWTTGGDKTLRNSYGTFTGRDMDFEAVTMEIACDPSAPYAITPGAYANVVNLMADIAKRNNLGELKWKADSGLVGNPSEQNVLVHRWFASKSCPGDAIYNQLGEICRLANEVNRTGIPYKPASIPTPAPTPASPVASPTLLPGATGSEVVKLQKNLNKFGFRLAEDGKYGNDTSKAVAGFQTLTKIGVDGKYGPQTAAKMKEFF